MATADTDTEHVPETRSAADSSRPSAGPPTPSLPGTCGRPSVTTQAATGRCGRPASTRPASGGRDSNRADPVHDEHAAGQCAPHDFPRGGGAAYGPCRRRGPARGRRRPGAGIVTDRDLVVRAMAHGLSPQAKVETVMFHAPVTVDAETAVAVALLVMRSVQGRHLPVVSEGRLVGTGHELLRRPVLAAGTATFRPGGRGRRRQEDPRPSPRRPAGSPAAWLTDRGFARVGGSAIPGRGRSAPSQLRPGDGGSRGRPRVGVVGVSQ